MGFMHTWRECVTENGVAMVRQWWSHRCPFLLYWDTLEAREAVVRSTDMTSTTAGVCGAYVYVTSERA